MEEPKRPEPVYVQNGLDVPLWMFLIVTVGLPMLLSWMWLCS